MEIRNLVFRTYGTSRINLDETYANLKKERKSFNWRNKPIGLWASPEARGFRTWKTWSIKENYKISSLDKWVDFKLKKDTKILVLASEKDLDKAWSIFSSKIRTLSFGQRRQFNWQKIEKHYDAVYFDWKSWNGNPKSRYDFICWDVDSLCVFNLKCIEVVKNKHKQNC